MHLSNDAAIIKAAGWAAFSVQVCMRHLCEHSSCSGSSLAEETICFDNGVGSGFYMYGVPICADSSGRAPRCVARPCCRPSAGAPTPEAQPMLFISALWKAVYFAGRSN